mmetsp:Transcript_12241/g.29627  ORF Transcript_12241/g.29627 Transcript_12241/m.29627 type:complete len:216 (+) Transcript_12241:1848-2495(+)
MIEDDACFAGVLVVSTRAAGLPLVGNGGCFLCFFGILAAIGASSSSKSSSVSVISIIEDDSSSSLMAVGTDGIALLLMPRAPTSSPPASFTPALINSLPKTVPKNAFTWCATVSSAVTATASLSFCFKHEDVRVSAEPHVASVIGSFALLRLGGLGVSMCPSSTPVATPNVGLSKDIVLTWASASLPPLTSLSWLSGRLKLRTATLYARAASFSV